MELTEKKGGWECKRMSIEAIWLVGVLNIRLFLPQNLRWSDYGKREEVISWSLWLLWLWLWLWVYFPYYKDVFFFFYNRKKHWRNREGVVNCFSLSLSSQFGPLAVALELGDTCFPPLHKSPPINFEKSGTCNYDLKLN